MGIRTTCHTQMESFDITPNRSQTSDSDYKQYPIKIVDIVGQKNKATVFEPANFKEFFLRILRGGDTALALARVRVTPDEIVLEYADSAHDLGSSDILILGTVRFRPDNSKDVSLEFKVERGDNLPVDCYKIHFGDNSCPVIDFNRGIQSSRLFFAKDGNVKIDIVQL